MVGPLKYNLSQENIHIEIKKHKLSQVVFFCTKLWNADGISNVLFEKFHRGLCGSF